MLNKFNKLNLINRNPYTEPEETRLEIKFYAELYPSLWLGSINAV